LESKKGTCEMSMELLVPRVCEVFGGTTVSLIVTETNSLKLL